MAKLNEFEGKKWFTMTDEEKEMIAKSISEEINKAGKIIDQAFSEGDELLELLRKSGVLKNVD